MTARLSLPAGVPPWALGLVNQLNTILQNVGGNVDLSGLQPLDGDLTALAGQTGTGLARRTGTDAWSLLPYEAGTWTPTLIGETVAGSVTYNIRRGDYIRVGQLVFFNAQVQWSTPGAASGPAAVTGLPFSHDTTSGARSDIVIGVLGNVNLAAGYTTMFGYVEAAAPTRVRLGQSGDSVGTLTFNIADFSSPVAGIFFSGCYRAAA